MKTCLCLICGCFTAFAFGCGEPRRPIGEAPTKTQPPSIVITPTSAPLEVAQVSAPPPAVAAQKPAGDWPHWRGPQHDGISREAGWNKTWEAKIPKMPWKAEVGTGFSSMSVADGKLYTMGNLPDAETKAPTEHVWCLNADTGEVIWRHSYPGELVDNLHEGGPGSTPTVDADRVYTLGRQGQLYCLNAANGEVIWSKNVSKELEVKQPEWGFTCSPLVLGDHLIVEAGHVVAYDKRTGDEIWRSEKKYRPGYGSPAAFKQGNETLLAVLNNDCLLVVKGASGEEVATYPWETSFVTTAATPIVKDDFIFISSGYNKGCALLQLKDGKLDVVYENRSMRNHMNNSVLHEGKLYGIDGNSHLARACKLVCMDFATGKVEWQERGYGCGSLLLSDNTLIVLADDGRLALVEASPAEFKELSRVQVLTGLCWTVPVLANGRIYARDSTGELVCLDVRS